MDVPSSTEMAASVTRVSFVAGAEGEWTIERASAIRGPALPTSATALRRVEQSAFVVPDGGTRWLLRGVRSNDRYLERHEKSLLGPIQPPLGRAASGMGVLIPIRKSDAWWNLPQDERRAIFESRSRHIAIGATYLPAVARRLYQCRDLAEPFDFLTWFEFDEADVGAFDELVGRLRDTEEWQYVVREVEVRCRRA